MSKKTLLSLVCALALLFGMTDVSSAALYEFDMGADSLVDTSGTNDVLEMQAVVNPYLDDIIFTLEEGESRTFPFATFYTTEVWINDDDINPGTIIALVDFDIPELEQEIEGTSIGFAGSWHFLQGWNLTWEDPVVVNFGYEDTGQFTAELSDVFYASWFWQGPDGSADVEATITLNSAPVPISQSVFLLGSGLLGLLVLGFRRRTREG